jgi:hypothetical protein
MLDTRASRVSITRKLQVTTLQKLDPLIQINNSTAGFYKIKFRVREIILFNIIQVCT